MKAQDKSPKTKNAGSNSVSSYIVLCFFAAFGVCFFTPVDIFLANASDIAFPIKPLILFMAFVTLAVFAALFLVCILTKGKVNNIFRALVFGIAAAFYIQGNFLAVNMGQLDGSRYELTLWKTALSIVIWLVIVAAPFFILIKYPKIFDNVVSYIPAAIILIQAVALTASVFINFSKYSGDTLDVVVKGDTRWICSPADLDLYSENKNVIIFLADTYDSFCFDSAVETDPDSVSEFDGFTYYTNTVGKYEFTNESLAYIFTLGKNGIYGKRTFFELVKSNFVTNFYCDTSEPPAPLISKYSDNFISKKVTLADTRGYAESIYKISFFRCMPEVLKPLFWSSGDIKQEIREKADDIISLPMYDVDEYYCDNLEFYNTIPRELRSTEENVFKFIYIWGLHAPRNVTGDLERDPGKDVSPEDAALGVNKIVNEYLRTLKANGMYDNSEIIFMADHGAYNRNKFPLLMYKPANQTGTGITISNAPISYDEMYPTLILLAGGNPDGRTIFDIAEDEERVRHFETTNEDITGNIKEDPQ